MTITKQLLKDLRVDIDEALKPIAQKYGIEIQSGSGVYGGVEGHLKILFKTTNEEGDDQRAIDYKRFASLYNLKEEWLGKTMKYGSDSYTIMGLDTNKRKNVLVVKRVRDGSIRIAPSSIAQESRFV